MASQGLMVDAIDHKLAELAETVDAIRNTANLVLERISRRRASFILSEQELNRLDTLTALARTSLYSARIEQDEKKKVELARDALEDCRTLAQARFLSIDVDQLQGLSIKQSPLSLGNVLFVRSADLDDYVSRLENEITTPSVSLREIVPGQQVGPVTFEVKQGILRVRHQNATPAEQDQRNVEAARAELLRQADSLTASLSKLNADGRLISYLVDLRERIASKQDVVQLGLAALALGPLVEGYKEEFSPIVTAQLAGLVSMISMYVGQFEDWARFTENAALSEFTSEDVETLEAVARATARDLQAMDEVVDPDVPATILYVLDRAMRVAGASKRGGLAIFRTLGNLVGAVARHAGDGALEGVKKAATIVVTTGILIVVAQAAVSMSPTASKVTGSSWIKQVGEILMEQAKKPAD